MLRPIPLIAITFIEQAESLRLTAYKDIGGVWTDGYGHLCGGPGTITIDVAKANLSQDINHAAEQLAAVVHEPVLLALTDPEYTALLSFVFNLGCNSSWTIWKDLNNQKFDDVPAQMQRFDKGHVDGRLQTIPGLAHRRLAEVTLWDSGDVPSAVLTAKSAPVLPPSSAATRSSIVTPPTPIARPLDIASLATKGVTAVTAIGATAAQLQGIVQPASDAVPTLAKIGTILTVVVVACSVVALLIHKAQAHIASH